MYLGSGLIHLFTMRLVKFCMTYDGRPLLVSPSKHSMDAATNIGSVICVDAADCNDDVASDNESPVI